MRSRAPVLAILAGCVAGWSVGCQSTQPPPRVTVPAHADTPEVTYNRDPMKPMPGPRAGGDIPPPPYSDTPLVAQHTPEEAAFVQAYNRVGRPRISVLVNSAFMPQDAAAIDSAATEATLADFFSANGQITLISPTAARQHLTDQQVKDLKAGTPGAAQQIAQEMNAEVLVEVRLEPVRLGDHPAARMVAEAVNARGGQSLGRAVVDVPPPLDERNTNDGARLLARKLMDEMTQTWSAFPPAPPAGAAIEPAPPQPTAATSPISEAPPGPAITVTTMPESTSSAPTTMPMSSETAPPPAMITVPTTTVTVPPPPAPLSEPATLPSR